MENNKLVNNLYSLLTTYSYHSKKSAISDTSESGHYLKANTTHDIAIQTVAPIQLKQLNVQILQYTKVCRLELTTLPDEAIEAHILPELAHSSLIPIWETV